jgi:thioredoxin-like negative regulator of GroEL
LKSHANNVKNGKRTIDAPAPACAPTNAGVNDMRNDKAPTAKAENGEATASLANGLSEAGAIDQVRELLFGAAKRTTENRLDTLDSKIEALRDDMNARFASLEAQLAEQGKETQARHLAGIDAIGQAIADLGASIRAMGKAR